MRVLRLALQLLSAMRSYWLHSGCSDGVSCFHAKDGEGYAFLGAMVLELDALNPQVAARLASSFNQYRRFDEGRQQLMRAQLERIAAKDGLSKDVREIVGRALKA